MVPEDDELENEGAGRGQPDPEKVARNRERALDRGRIAKLIRLNGHIKVDDVDERKENEDAERILKKITKKDVTLDDDDVNALQDMGFLYTAEELQKHIDGFRNDTSKKSFIEYLLQQELTNYVEKSKARHAADPDDKQDGYALQYALFPEYIDRLEQNTPFTEDEAKKYESLNGFIKEQDQRAKHRELFIAAAFFTDPNNQGKLPTYNVVHSNGVQESIPIPPQTWAKAQAYYPDWNGKEPLPDVNVKKAKNRSVIRVDNLGVDLTQLCDIMNQNPKNGPIQMAGVAANGKPNPFLLIKFEHDGKQYWVGSRIESGVFKVHAYYEDANGNLIQDDFKGWLDYPVKEPTAPPGMSVTDAVADACLKLAFFKNEPIPLTSAFSSGVGVHGITPETTTLATAIMGTATLVTAATGASAVPVTKNPVKTEEPNEEKQEKKLENEEPKKEPEKEQEKEVLKEKLTKESEEKLKKEKPESEKETKKEETKEEEPGETKEETIAFIVEYLPGIVNLLQKAAIDSSGGAKAIPIEAEETLTGNVSDAEAQKLRRQNMVKELGFNVETTKPTLYAVEAGDQITLYNEKRKGLGVKVKESELDEDVGLPLYCDPDKFTTNSNYKRNEGTLNLSSLSKKNLDILKDILKGAKDFKIIKAFLQALTHEFGRLPSVDGKTRDDQFKELVEVKLQKLENGSEDEKRVAANIRIAILPTVRQRAEAAKTAAAKVKAAAPSDAPDRKGKNIDPGDKKTKEEREAMKVHHPLVGAALPKDAIVEQPVVPRMVEEEIVETAKKQEKVVVEAPMATEPAAEQPEDVSYEEATAEFVDNSSKLQEAPRAPLFVETTTQVSMKAPKSATADVKEMPESTPPPPPPPDLFTSNKTQSERKEDTPDIKEESAAAADIKEMQKKPIIKNESEPVDLIKNLMQLRRQASGHLNDDDEDDDDEIDQISKELIDKNKEELKSKKELPKKEYKWKIDPDANATRTGVAPKPQNQNLLQEIQTGKELKKATIKEGEEGKVEHRGSKMKKVEKVEKVEENLLKSVMSRVGVVPDLTKLEEGEEGNSEVKEKKPD